MREFKIFILFELLLCFIHFPGFSQFIDATDRNTQIHQILKNHGIPGAGVALISKDSIIWMEYYGFADVQNEIPVSESTLFTIGSISKTFLSAGTLIAEEKGLLDILEPIEGVISEIKYKNQWKASHPVRLIHLLEHTSGFDEAHFSLFPRANSATPLRELVNLNRKSLETRWKPGHYYEYNTLGYMTAAFILEEKVGEPFEKFISENLLMPLEINVSSYHPQKTNLVHFSKSYSGKDIQEIPFPSLPQWPSGSLTLTTEGLSKFVRMLMSDGRYDSVQIMDSISVKRLEIPETSLLAQSGVSLGYSKGLLGQIEKGKLFYGHSGRYGGFLSEFAYSRDLDLGFVILLNHVDGGKAIKEIKSLLLAHVADPEEGEDVDIQVSEAELINEISGCYQPITSFPQLGKLGFFLYRLMDLVILEEEEGHLYQSSMMGGKQRLVQVQDRIFRFQGEPIGSCAIVEGADGKWEFLTQEASYRKIPLWWGYLQFYTAMGCVLFLIAGFLILPFWILIRWIQNKKKFIRVLATPFLAICCLLGMVVSVVFFYNPEKLYSIGSILFFLLGWAFLFISLLSLYQAAKIFPNTIKANPWMKYAAMLISLTCCITSLYLFYWDMIGLMLWDY
ncbi:serine hydrolase domain-containing protein [Algoriphagus sp. D3-2-R+10]|uniref:serine hydrolase domain-containing protein n=1 Tax=Algoriphagus aurantiacus TaxID=3103948 RepID=UPI002B3964B8|nr:serine hydrolase domain-containing protein [Algoriphagus sp. D3-2-R+10]MEB2777825.1 serine hydrolase domain-containing protein [Algoriphagus sp. D3-2-R+10]